VSQLIVSLRIVLPEASMRDLLHALPIHGHMHLYQQHPHALLPHTNKAQQQVCWGRVASLLTCYLCCMNVLLP
jgi:hypothetical protein